MAQEDAPNIKLLENEFALMRHSPTHPHSPSGTKISAVAGATGAAALLDACGANPGSGSSNTVEANPDNTAALTGASRFLSQATIGYAKSDVTALASSNYAAWLTTQLSMARPQTFWDFLMSNGYDSTSNQYWYTGYEPMIWSQLIGSGDVLRQRVGLALLDIWVVSVDSLSLWPQFSMAVYLDVLWNNAFGNYRDIMEGVSTSVAMSVFLTYIWGPAGNPATGTIADENYARELMQLFTIGLYQLNMDGSEVLSSGSPVATFTQADVSAAARVWTGYGIFPSVYTTPTCMSQPMGIDPYMHDNGAITLFNGAVNIPAGTDGVTARKLLLDGLFNQTSMPPFVSKQLIQRLVTSNPSPAYINRVANIFVDNGNGVRGDMTAIIRAILTDTEARDDSQINSTTFGKLREPVVRMTHWARAFNVTSPSNAWAFGNLTSGLAESPGHAPSVFNWFRPNYTPPGTKIASSGLLAPEFQIENESTMIAYVNQMQSLIVNGAGDAVPDYSSLVNLAADNQQLLDELNLVLAANEISSATISQIKSSLDNISAGTSDGIKNRIYAGILLIMASPEYLVLR